MRLGQARGFTYTGPNGHKVKRYYYPGDYVYDAIFVADDKGRPVLYELGLVPANPKSSQRPTSPSMNSQE